MSDTALHRRSPRRALDLEQLKSDPASLLSLGLADPVLRKLETYRLYCAGYAAEDIAQAFGFARPYLYALWAELKTAGVAGLVDQRRGSAPRTRTPEREAQVLRAKALQPQRGDADLAAEFAMDRSTVYELLKEHGLQDLHRVLTAAPPSAPAASPVATATVAAETAAKKGGLEIIPCAHALSLTLLNPLDVTDAYAALAPLSVAAADDRYTDRALQTALLFLSAAGIQRLAHVNDQPIAAWGTVLDTARRPDADTLDRYLQAIQTRDNLAAAERPPAGASVRPPQGQAPAPATARPGVSVTLAAAPAPVGQIQPAGPIAAAQSQTLAARVAAGLCQDPVWYFDGHTIEYSGQAQIGKTLHGTKHLSVKAVDEYCLFNHVPGLTCYYPTSVPYAQALRAMLTQAQAALPADRRIRQLAFDKEGWDADLLQWLVQEQAIIPFTWVKDTAPNRALLAGVDWAEFVALDEAVTVGKSDQEHCVRRLADVDLTFSDLGVWRVVVLETETGTRLGIATTALRPAAALADPGGMATVAVLNAMRYKQRIENSFKVRRHEMASDALPTHQVHTVVQAVPYDLAQAQSQVSRAEQRLAKHHAAHQHLQELWERGELDKHEFNALTARTNRLAAQAQATRARVAADLTQAQTDPATGQTTLTQTTEVLDLRKLTLLNLFKEHALIALHVLAHLLGLDGAGPERLRRQFLAHGDRVEFDHEQRILTVFAKPFPRTRTQRAYEWLCAQLNQRPVTFIRDGTPYRVRFSW